MGFVLGVSNDLLVTASYLKPGGKVSLGTSLRIKLETPRLKKTFPGLSLYCVSQFPDHLVSASFEYFIIYLVYNQDHPPDFLALLFSLRFYSLKPTVHVYSCFCFPFMEISSWENTVCTILSAFN